MSRRLAYSRILDFQIVVKRHPCLLFNECVTAQLAIVVTRDVTVGLPQRRRMSALEIGAGSRAYRNRLCR